jgi:cell division ATPase FtsA
VGGNHVTRDISIGLRTPFEIAERLKVERGVASPSLIPHGEALEVISAGSGERLRLPRAILGEIIEARMSELFEISRAAIEGAGMQNRIAGGVILTGGGATLPGATDLAQQVFDLPVRLGKPIGLSGWSDKVDTPQFATGVGLLRFALRQPGTLGNPLATASNPQLAPAMAPPERRVWSAPAASINGDHREPAPAAPTHQTSAPQGVPSVAGVTQRPPQRHAPGVPAYRPHQEQEAAAYADAVPSGNAVEELPVESPVEEQKTPFDRLSRRADDRPLTQDDGEPKEQSLWQKLITGLRNFFGLENA